MRCDSAGHAGKHLCVLVILFECVTTHVLLVDVSQTSIYAGSDANPLEDVDARMLAQRCVLSFKVST